MSRLFFAIAIAGAKLATAGPCTTTTLDQYIALGSVGCSVGNNTIFGFQNLLGQTGALPIASSSIQVTTSGGNLGPTINFSTNLTINFPLFDEALITYQIKGNSYLSEIMTLAGSSGSNGGYASTVQNYCPNGTFSMNGVTGCPSDQSGTHNVLINFGNGSSPVTFSSPASSLSITDDYVLDASGGGSIIGGSLTDSFAAAPIAAGVPEPGTYLLTGLAMVVGLLISKLRPATYGLQEVKHEHE